MAAAQRTCRSHVFGKDQAMGKLRTLIDPYLLLLIGTIGVAALFPAHGSGVAVADAAVTVAVALLFFLYGARLAPQAIWQGMAHWRLQVLVFLSTFLLFPLIGLAVVHTIGGFVAPDIAVGLLFLCVLPSTVQSSIAFTSIARGNVPAALCSASLSNLVGVALTPVLTALLLPTSASGGFSPHALESIAMQILLPLRRARWRGRSSATGWHATRRSSAMSIAARSCWWSMPRSARAWSPGCGPAWRRSTC
jgi:sodium/bile acid cotransporter 7